MEWPALSRVFGLYPWDVERLTLAELNVYVATLRGEPSPTQA